VLNLTRVRIWDFIIVVWDSRRKLWKKDEILVRDDVFVKIIKIIRVAFSMFLKNAQNC